MSPIDFLAVVRDAVRCESTTGVVNDDVSFTDNGLDSMALLSLLTELNSQLPLTVTVNDVITHATPRQLAAALDIRASGGLGAWLSTRSNNASPNLETFADLVLETPYNSARAFLELYCESPLPRGQWGHNCIGLSHTAQARLLGGDHSTYLSWGRRRPLIFAHAGEIYFADPYALHRQCAPIGELLRQSQASHTYPCFPGADHGMTLSHDRASSTMRQIKHTPRGSMTCPYSTERISFEVDPLNERLLFDNEQDNLSIRVVSDDQSTTAHLVVPLASAYRQRQTLERCRPAYFAILHDQLHDRGSHEFDAALGMIAARIGVASGEVIDFMEAAFWAYLKHAPSELTFSKPHANPSNL